ncbi:MAG: ChbG/HpnK family deacetylase [Acidobacteriaceae bacterium]
MRKRLIVNADDFGYTAGVNRAIAECAQQGILTSATLMASGAAFEDAVVRATAAGGKLSVGCHVVLVDGTPISAATRLAHAGRFASSPLRLLRSAAGDPELVQEIAAETQAQVERLRSHAIAPTHVDTHKHAHIFPPILRAFLRGAKRAGVDRVRNPFEPAWSLGRRQAFRAVHRKRTLQVALLRVMRRRFVSTVTSEGFRTTDGSIGIVTTGTLDTPLLVHMLDRLPEGTWELVCHPGYDDAELRRNHTRLTCSRDTERQAIISREVRSAVERNGIELISYAQL